MELEDSISRGENKGRIVKDLEYKFGEGKLIDPNIKQIIKNLSDKMDINKCGGSSKAESLFNVNRRVAGSSPARPHQNSDKMEVGGC